MTKSEHILSVSCRRRIVRCCLKYPCSGTNPESDYRVYDFTLPRYIGEHCATVDEALECVKTLDLYAVDGYWNYCFMMADATGHYGLLEIAQNKVIWHEGQQAQTNFYINEELAAIEDYQCGYLYHIKTHFEKGEETLCR